MSFAFARFWIALWAFLSVAGWVFSALHSLGRAAYVAFLVLGLVAVAVWHPFRGVRWRPVWRRWRRPLPLSFALLLGAIVVSGCLYAPSNYDALAYRLPRLLHWLAEGGWHWIHTGFERVNTRAADCEWVMTPFLLTGSERAVWVLNAACFAALPGLLYPVFLAVGVLPRAAYRWRWLLPSASVFIIEAGGDANDLPGVYFSLAAVALALRARSHRSPADLLWSGLALAVAMGTKVSNAPLALPWAVAAWPSLRLAARRPVLTAGTLVVAALVSFLPTAVLNQRFSGDWSGASLEMDHSIVSAPAWVHAFGNAVNLTVQNLVPPVFPWAARWNAAFPALFPEPLRSRLATGLEGGDKIGLVGEIPTEDNATLGPILLLLVVACGLARLHDKPASSTKEERWRRLLCWSPWVALAVFLCKMTLLEMGRLTAPFYLLLTLPLLAGASAARCTAAWWWRAGAALQIAVALGVLIIHPSRPLFPALTLLKRLPTSPTVLRARTTYAVFRTRPEALAPLRALLPPEAGVIGLLTHNDLEASLWRPYGTRRFRHVVHGDSAAAMSARGLEYLVISERAFGRQTQEPLAAWLARLSAEVVATVPIVSLASEPAVRWYLVRLRPEPSPLRSPE